MKEILHELLTGLSRWPLLMAAVVCFSFVLWEEMVTDETEIVLASAGMIVGCVLLGAWLVSYIVAGERSHYAKHRPIWIDAPLSPEEGEQSSAPPATGVEQDGAEGSRG
jgi:hypothetical protein